MPIKGSKRSKYAHFLEDPDIERWYDNTARGSQVTADVYLRRLGAFCNKKETTPLDLASMEEDELQNIVLDFVTWSERQGHAGSYIKSTLKAVKSWLSHNRRELKTKIKIKGAQDTPTLKDERVPTPQELKEILLSGDKKSRTACVLMAHSGLRNSSLGNYQGDDGLKVGDLPELVLDDGTIDFERVPTMIVVRKEISKAKHQYLTFLGEEGCEYLRAYLEERMREGEQIGAGSPIITPKTASKPFIRAINIGDIIRSSIRGAGYPWRPYVLRSYFDTQLMLAESKGLVLRDYRQFWMGHKGDIEARYTTNKQRLPQHVIEDMRSAYRRSQEYLETTEAKSSEEKIRQSLRRQLLSVAGYGDEEIDQMDLDSIENEEFQTKVKQRLVGEMINNGATQKVVTTEELEGYIEQGWEFVATLPNRKIVVRLPKT